MGVVDPPGVVEPPGPDGAVEVVPPGVVEVIPPGVAGLPGELDGVDEPPGLPGVGVGVGVKKLFMPAGVLNPLGVLCFGASEADVARETVDTRGRPTQLAGMVVLTAGSLLCTCWATHPGVHVHLLNLSCSCTLTASIQYACP